MQSLRNFIDCAFAKKNKADEEDFITFNNQLSNLHMFYVPSDRFSPEFYVGKYTGDFKCFDIPFGNCWFEFITPLEIAFHGGNIDLLGVGVLEETPEKQILTYVFKRKSDGLLGCYMQVLTNYCLSIAGNERFSLEKFSRVMYLATKEILTNISNRTLNYVENDQSVNTRGRLNGVFTKVKYKPSDVIYVLPKKEFDKLPEKITSRVIQKPSYAYEVMGHWRKLQSPTSIGKDRQNQRGVRGYTWISAHVRGEGDIFKKTRIVK